MALRLLCLTLLGALKIHAQDGSQNRLFEPSLNEVPLQPDFQDTLFQGKWYGVGAADNLFWQGKQRKIKMFSNFYDLNDDHSYNVTATLLRGPICDHWTRTLLPSAYPGQFTLKNTPYIFQLQRYTVKVVATNYNEFAIVYTEKDFTSKVIFSIDLYGRTKTLSPAVKEKFANFVKSRGLFESNIIFTERIENCIDG